MNRFVQERVFLTSDEKILQNHSNGMIGIFYGSNNYKNDLNHINELKKDILNDYPTLKDEDIKVWYIERNQSDRHASFTMLWVEIPIDDFIKFRYEGKIDVL